LNLAPVKHPSNHRRWFAKTDPRLKALLDQIRKENGGPLLRFNRSHGGLYFSLPCGIRLTRATLLALKRRGWVRELEPFDSATRRETWMVTA
jgi:hypothetical protein